MKGIKIEIENEQPMYLYRPYDVIGAIAHALYYSANPDSEMCVPNCAYEKAEKMFEEWRDETREKKAVELLTKEERNCKNCGKTSCKNYGCDLPFTCGSYREKV